MVAQVKHYINGKQVSGRNGRMSSVFNPATGEQTGLVPIANAADIGDAVAAATRAAPGWAATTPLRRARILNRFLRILEDRIDELADIIVAEHGKVHSDAVGEIQRGMEVVEFATAAPQLLKGELTENVGTRVDSYSTRQPLGVVAGITPFNFPAMVPMWFFPIAIAAGNAVVLKPSEKDPSTANWLAGLWKEAGLPDGIFNVLHGDKTAVDALLTDPRVKAISFVGSTPIARHVYSTGTAHGKRVQALGGAKNHMLVLPDADLDLAADAAVNAGFGSAGERCMAISALVAVDAVADELIGKIADRIATLRTGDGRRGCDMGPLVTGVHRDKVQGYVDAGVDAGAELVVDGREQHFDGELGGFWLGPTLFDNVTTAMGIYADEIFGPVLSVVRVQSYSEGLDLINDSPYGNGTAIFTNDGGAARRYQNEVEVGMVGINVPVPVPVGYYSFGGWKASLFGDTHAHGTEGFSFYTRNKVITTRWLDPSHGGVNLGFPQND